MVRGLGVRLLLRGRHGMTAAKRAPPRSDDLSRRLPTGSGAERALPKARNNDRNSPAYFRSVAPLSPIRFRERRSAWSESFDRDNIFASAAAPRSVI